VVNTEDVYIDDDNGNVKKIVNTNNTVLVFDWRGFNTLYGRCVSCCSNYYYDAMSTTEKNTLFGRRFQWSELEKYTTDGRFRMFIFFGNEYESFCEMTGLDKAVVTRW
jgi:hypothetical protein